MSIVRIIVWFLIIFGAMALQGCATSAHTSVGDSTAAHAECPVCRCNADLACLDVKVTAETPHSEYQGRTYYFCSGECKAAFDRDPARYVKK